MSKELEGRIETLKEKGYKFLKVFIKVKGNNGREDLEFELPYSKEIGKLLEKNVLG